MFQKHHVVVAACIACIVGVYVHQNRGSVPKKMTHTDTSVGVDQAAPVHVSQKTGHVRHKQKTDASPDAVRETQGNYDTVMAKDAFGRNAHAKVDYYALALSWSPGFCAFQRQKNQGQVPKKLAFQCNNAQKFGWVIHGLWPQNAQATRVDMHPRFCQGDLPQVSAQVIQQHLNESPGAALLQGEWEKHGACAFDTAQAYFTQQQTLYRKLHLPKEALSRGELFRWMRQHNPQLNGVRLGGGPREMYVCYDLKWQPMGCPAAQFK